MPGWWNGKATSQPRHRKGFNHRTAMRRKPVRSALNRIKVGRNTQFYERWFHLPANLWVYICRR